jgi:hypothetical protein
MRKMLISLAAAAAVATPIAVTAPAQAYAGTPGCVTKAEYNSVTKGMTQTQVAKRFGTSAKPYWGTVTFSWDSDYSHERDREYKRCNKYGKPVATWRGSVEVDFVNEMDFDDDFNEYWSPGYLASDTKHWSAY